MNGILKIGILWILISIPLNYFLPPVELWRSFLVASIGIILVSVGFIINEYQAYKFEKT
jgi:hypothetical protein